jgi:hypothetical protein
MKDFYQWYSEADAMVLVKIVGEERKSLGDQLSKLEALVNRETPLYNLRVLRSWKKTCWNRSRSLEIRLCIFVAFRLIAERFTAIPGDNEQVLKAGTISGAAAKEGNDMPRTAIVVPCAMIAR